MRNAIFAGKITVFEMTYAAEQKSNASVQLRKKKLLDFEKRNVGERSEMRYLQK